MTPFSFDFAKKTKKLKTSTVIQKGPTMTSILYKWRHAVWINIFWKNNNDCRNEKFYMRKRMVRRKIQQFRQQCVRDFYIICYNKMTSWWTFAEIWPLQCHQDWSYSCVGSKKKENINDRLSCMRENNVDKKLSYDWRHKIWDFIEATLRSLLTGGSIHFLLRWLTVSL